MGNPFDGIGGRVREIRESLTTATGKQWSQEVLARRAEVSVGTVSKLENGVHMPRMETLSKIAYALGVSASVLLGEAS